jgi:hypothetical protein
MNKNKRVRALTIKGSSSRALTLLELLVTLVL